MPYTAMPRPSARDAKDHERSTGVNAHHSPTMLTTPESAAARTPENTAANTQASINNVPGRYLAASCTGPDKVVINAGGPTPMSTSSILKRP